METPRFAEILVYGSDAASFLHAQLTCDVKALGRDACQFGGYCGADGRVIALFLIARTGDDEFRLLLPQALASVVLPTLQRYRLRARCTLALAEVEITGETGEPTFALDARRWQHAGFSWRVYALPAGLAAPPLPPELWRQQLALGIPWLVPQTSSRFLPQMLGMERLQAYSLRKGCYPGQEVIARTHFLGRSKRRLARVRAVQADPVLPAGVDLVLQPGDGPAGTLVVIDDTGCGLAVLAEAATPGLFVLAGGDNHATLVIERDVSETIGDASLNGRCDPPSSA